MSEAPISPLRQRMIDDMRVRKFGEKTQEEVARLLEAAPGVKYKAALGVAYGAGLRVSEVANLKISDNNGSRPGNNQVVGFATHQ
jgi:integrase